MRKYAYNSLGKAEQGQNLAKKRKRKMECKAPNIVVDEVFLNAMLLLAPNAM
jgi:hypothetical protein